MLQVGLVSITSSLWLCFALPLHRLLIRESQDSKHRITTVDSAANPALSPALSPANCMGRIERSERGSDLLHRLVEIIVQSTDLLTVTEWLLTLRNFQ